MPGTKTLGRPAALVALLALLISAPLASLRVRPAAAVGSAAGTVTITDDRDASGVLGPSVSNREGDSGLTPFVFRVTFRCTGNQPQVGQQFVDFTTMDNTALAGGDYTATSGTLTFDFGIPPTQACSAQSFTRTVTVNVHGDTKTENTESFFVRVTPRDASVAAVQGTGIIVNDDGPTISIADASAHRPSSGVLPMTFWVTLSEPAPDVTFAVDYELLPGTDVATSAQGGQDYALLTGASDSGRARAATLKFPPGETREPIVVPVYGNTLNAADQTFGVRLFNSDVKGIDRSRATGTILNDNPVPALTVSDAWVSEGTGASPTNMVFTVSLPPPYSEQSVSVDYATADGTATAGTDYTLSSGRVTLEPFTPSTTIKVPLVPDNSAEPNETLTLALSNPVHATLSRVQARGTIINDDGRAFAFSDLADLPPVSGAAQTVTVTAKASFLPGAATDPTFTGTPTLSAPDDTHFTPGQCGVAVLGVSTCSVVVFGDLGVQHLVATSAAGVADPSGTTAVVVQPTGLSLEAASATVQAGFPLPFTARPVVGVDGASIDGYRAPRSLTVAGGGSSPGSGSPLSCLGAVCQFDVTFPDTGSPSVQVSDGSVPTRTSSAVVISVNDAATPPPGPPEGELPFPLVAKVDLYDGSGVSLPDGETSGETLEGNGKPPAAKRIADLMAVDPGLRLLLATGSDTPQISVLNVDSLRQVQTIPLNFGTPTTPAGPTTLLVDAVHHLAFASDGKTLATVRLRSSSTPQFLILPSAGPLGAKPGFAVSAARGVLYVLTNETDKVRVHAYDGAKLAAGNTTELWTGGYSVPPNVCPATRGGLGFDEADSFLFFLCSAVSGITDATGTPGRAGVVARIDLDSGASTLPITTQFYSLATTATSQLLNPLDGRLTQFGRGTNSFDPITGLTFDVGHGAFLGTTQLTATGAINGVTSSASNGRNYLFDSTDFAQSSNPVTGQAVFVTLPTRLTVSQAGQLPADNGVAYQVLDGVFPVHTGNPPVAAFDPVTRRLFMFGSGYTRPTDRFGGFNNSQQITITQPSHPVFVFQDRLPAAPAAAAANPDAGTNDVEEVPGRTPVSYAAGASAYGAVRRTLGGYLAFGNDVPASGAGRVAISAQVSSSSLSGSGASAAAVGTSLDAGTEKDIADNGGPPPESTSTQFVPSHCGDLTGHATAVTDNQGSTVSCDLAKTTVTAAASEDAQSNGPPPGADALMQVGSAQSWTSLTRDPVKGSVARAEAIARDITIGGVLHIGEVHTIAESIAHGRPGKATSTFTSSISHVVLTDPTGVPIYACDTCPTVATVANAINSLAGTNLSVRPGEPDLNPLVHGSPGGAQAGVLKAPYDYWNDINSYDDPTHEVYGLEVFLSRTGTDLSSTKRGLLLELAGVSADAHYAIGLPLPVPVAQPGSLKIALLDAPPDVVPPGMPLAGGAFEVHADSDADGVLGLADPLIPGGACLTAADGTGTCSFAELVPGAYVIHETAPPAGYAGAPDLAVTITSAFRTVVTYVNPKAVGRIEVTLGDTAHPPSPLGGGTFEVFADNGDGTLGPTDTSVGTCMTDATGACPAFVDVPLGAYVVHEKSPPPGYLGAPDAAFALTLPGQLAKSDFVNPEGVGVVAVSVADDGTPPKPLAGGVFDLYADDGDGTLGAADVLRISCATTARGACPLLTDVPLGHYLVHEKTAPAGYAASGDTAFSLTKAEETAQVGFINPKAVGRIEVSLTDAAKPPKPLAGGVFQLVTDVNRDGKLDPADRRIGTCTTNAAGVCPSFVDAPLGAYVVHQQSAPKGYLAAGDAHFALSKPAEIAKVSFADGTPGTPPTSGKVTKPGTPGQPGKPPVFIPGKPGKKPTYVTEVVVTPGKKANKPSVITQPIVAPNPGVLQQFAALPANAFRLLTRTPMQALLFALVWLLLGMPGYLGTRRHRLSRIREGI